MRIPKRADTAPRHLKPLQDWMYRTNRNQADLAELLGVSSFYVSLILSGKRSVPVLLAIKIALVTGLPVEKICTDREGVRILKLFGEQQNHVA